MICLVLIGEMYRVGRQAVKDVEVEVALYLVNPHLCQKLPSRKWVEEYVERMLLMVLFWTFTFSLKLLLFQWMVTELILLDLWMTLSLR